MKITNKTKDMIVVAGILLVVFWLLLGATYWVISLFAEEITTPNQMNKFYTEETIKTEMRFLAMWNYTEKMPDQEWEKTFLKGE